MTPPAPADAAGKPLNPRQERFCHAFVQYANAAVAAREAGYAPASAKNQGYRLVRTGRIRARIRAIHAELWRDHGADAESLMGKLENVYRRAVEDHHFHTAARAVELQARLRLMQEKRPPVQALPPLPPAPLDRAPLGPGANDDPVTTTGRPGDDRPTTRCLPG